MNIIRLLNISQLSQMVECVCTWVNVHAQIHVKPSSGGRYGTCISISACTKHCLRKGIQNHCVEVNVSVPIPVCMHSKV